MKTTPQKATLNDIKLWSCAQLKLSVTVSGSELQFFTCCFCIWIKGASGTNMQGQITQRNYGAKLGRQFDQKLWKLRIKCGLDWLSCCTKTEGNSQTLQHLTNSENQSVDLMWQKKRVQTQRLLICQQESVHFVSGPDEETCCNVSKVQRCCEESLFPLKKLQSLCTVDQTSTFSFSLFSWAFPPSHSGNFKVPAHVFFVPRRKNNPSFFVFFP